MEIPISDIFSTLIDLPLEAYAHMRGRPSYPEIQGMVYFYPLWNGTFVIADIAGLPFEEGPCNGKIYGFHIHEGGTCTGDAMDPFGDVGDHFDFHNCPHPQHAGDFPNLFGNDGYALSMFFTNRFTPEEAVGHTAIIHDMPDDFRSQPFGHAGEKLACGEIEAVEEIS